MTAKQARILMVDDDVVTARTVCQHLNEHQVDLATSGLEALALVSKRTFDLVLLDVVMPGLDGFTVLRTLRSDIRTRELPLVMLTILDERKHIEEGFACGADDYLIKPVDPWYLRVRLRAHLDRERMRRAVRAQLRSQAILEVARSLDHQINNPLFCVSGFTELLRARSGPEALEPARRVLEASKQIAALVTALALQAAHGTEPDQVLNLDDR